MSTVPSSRLRRLMLAAAPAALAISMFAAGPASAGFFGEVAIVDADSGQQVIVDSEPHVCGFWIEFDFDRVVDVIAWEIKEWNASPLDGATVLNGQGGPTDADGKLRQPESGSLTLPEGHYSIVWDDESAVDASFGHQSFVVDCEDQATGSQPAPTDTDLGAGGSGGAGGGVAGLTAPPTDASPDPAAASSSTAIPAAISVLAVLTLAFTTSAQRLHERSRRRPR